MKTSGATKRVSKRQTILRLLKQQGPRDAETLAGQLVISAMAVRQHLYALSAEGLVSFQQESRPLGRPAKMWRLTPAAAAQFPDAHAGLAMNLLVAAQQAFGADGLKRLISRCAKRQLADYRVRLPAGGALGGRLEALAPLRNQDGFMAELRSQPDGSYLLVHNHCPIAAAAGTCERLCQGEMEVYRGVLGKGVAITRIEHIMAGKRRCVYRISDGRSAAKPPLSSGRNTAGNGRGSEDLKG